MIVWGAGAMIRACSTAGENCANSRDAAETGRAALTAGLPAVSTGAAGLGENLRLSLTTTAGVAPLTTSEAVAR
jgi:hypothetical protein